MQSIGRKFLCNGTAILAPKLSVSPVAVLSNRSFATKGPSTESKGPEKSVFISQSTDIYTNLALEDWLYKRSNFENHRVLLLWRNDPCVVIGRHQNPFIEVDVEIADENRLPIARRNSGGGCVYHDKGNLNCTFFSPRTGYDRKMNLEVICKALKRQFGIEAEITPREDVTLHGYKISGTASKLGKNAYHHCTVLVDADLNKLSALLNPDTEGLDSRSTKSVKSPVKNLKDANPNVDVGQVLSSIGYEFLRTDDSGNDGGQEMIEKQRGFQMINPTNDWFPGLDQLRAEYKGWDWSYGRTPEFTFHRSYPINLQSHGMTKIEFKMRITKGRVEFASLEVPAEKKALIDGATYADLSGFINAIKGRVFHAGIVRNFERLLLRTDASVSDGIPHDNCDLRQALLNA